MHINALLSLLSLSSAAVAAGGFKATCWGYELTEGTIFSAICRGDGFKEKSRIDLNECYATVEDGSIVPRKNGGFHGRCKSCYVSNPQGNLLCDCQKGDGTYTLGYKVLDNDIVNLNGHLFRDVNDGGVHGQCDDRSDVGVSCDDERISA